MLRGEARLRLGRSSQPVWFLLGLVFPLAEPPRLAGLAACLPGSQYCLKCIGLFSVCLSPHVFTQWWFTMYWLLSSPVSWSLKMAARLAFSSAFFSSPNLSMVGHFLTCCQSCSSSCLDLIYRQGSISRKMFQVTVSWGWKFWFHLWSQSWVNWTW